MLNFRHNTWTQATFILFYPAYLLMLVWKVSALVFTAPILSKIFSCGETIIHSSLKFDIIWINNHVWMWCTQKCTWMATPKSFPSSILGMRCWIQLVTYSNRGEFLLSKLINFSNLIHSFTEETGSSFIFTATVIHLQWWWSLGKHKSLVSPSVEALKSSHSPWWSHILELKSGKRRN